jgi:exodeoxyribonuclease-5
MNTTEFHKLLKGKFPFELTIKQDVVLQRLATFVLDQQEDNLFILKGYAGTGKTTLISTLVNSLWNAHKSAVLLAPTGRAAKVISKYSKREALTIHKKIYFPKKRKWRRS